MKKYIVPTIKVEKIELIDMIATSANFVQPGEGGLPTLGTDKGEEGGPGNSAEGLSKSSNIWEAWD